MNLYLLLHQDHEKARTLFEQLEASGEDEGDRRERLFSTLYRELDLPAEAEEKFLYPRLKANEETRELALTSLDDHKEMKRLLSALASMDAGTPEWTAKCRALREECEAHILREEQEMFPRAQRAIEDEEAAGIAEDIESFKESQSEMEIG